MFEFEVVQEIKPNTEILKIIKDCTFTIKNGKVKHLLKTNLQFIEPAQYIITYPTTLTILEYKVNEISSKNFYIKELLKKLDCNIENDEVIFKNKLGFTFIFDSLNRKSKKELIKRLIECIEIKRDKNYNIEITNVKFTEEFISKSRQDYIKYLYEILQNNDIGFIYKEAITKEDLEKLQEDYFVFSNKKIANGEYDKEDLTIYMELIKAHFYTDGIINCPYIEDGNIVDNVTLISKNIVEIC